MRHGKIYQSKCYAVVVMILLRIFVNAYLDYSFLHLRCDVVRSIVLIVAFSPSLILSVRSSFDLLVSLSLYLSLEFSFVHLRNLRCDLDPCSCIVSDRVRVKCSYVH